MELSSICKDFRDAIEKAREERCFDVKDRMNGFPRGCCDDTCDLLAFYLKTMFGIETMQMIKEYKPNIIEERCYHAVLLMGDKRIIDLTGDQFLGGEPVYVGFENGFYKEMNDVEIKDNYDISKQDRLWNDYRTILNKLNN